MVDGGVVVARALLGGTSAFGRAPALTTRPTWLITSQVMPEPTSTTTTHSATAITAILCFMRLIFSSPVKGCRSVDDMASVVVVEDDPAIRYGLQQALRDRDFVVATSPTGLGALELIMRVEPDVVLLDLGLPDVDGLQILGMLRGVSQVPVIVITARDDDPTIVLALDAGADDYVVKPFGLDHVAARIRAVLRRGTPTDGDTMVRVGDLAIDPRQRTVALDGAPVDLTRKEFDLLLALASRSGEVVSKRTLLAEVWQQAYGGSDRTVDVHLSWLRRKLGETAAEPRYLLTVRGVGIRLVAPDRPG